MPAWGVAIDPAKENARSWRLSRANDIDGATMNRGHSSISCSSQICLRDTAVTIVDQIQDELKSFGFWHNTRADYIRFTGGSKADMRTATARS